MAVCLDDSPVSLDPSVAVCCISSPEEIQTLLEGGGW